jgi:hypothetical protein
MYQMTQNNNYHNTVLRELCLVKYLVKSIAYSAFLLASRPFFWKSLDNI